MLYFIEIDTLLYLVGNLVLPNHAFMLTRASLAKSKGLENAILYVDLTL